MYRSKARGHCALLQTMLPLLRKVQGQIVFVNSSAGLRSPVNAGQFSATQHAVRPARRSQCGWHPRVKHFPRPHGHAALGKAFCQEGPRLQTEFCREFGISRKTGYKIFDGYQECGVQGLTDRSRRPYRYANQLPFQVENFNLNVKREHASWGARKIRERLLRRFSGIPIPAKSTIRPRASSGPGHRSLRWPASQ
jgi:leucine-zipper of insertion element IS481